MRILAATQADNVALESEKLGQGLLTYALVDEGLKAHKAAPDGKGPITIGAWLRYAEKRVPQLYDDIQGGSNPGHQTRSRERRGAQSHQRTHRRPVLPRPDRPTRPNPATVRLL